MKKVEVTLFPEGMNLKCDQRIAQLTKHTIAQGCPWTLFTEGEGMLPFEDFTDAVVYAKKMLIAAAVADDEAAT